ncbi:hypothetical protein [Streptomyces mirabilis]
MSDQRSGRDPGPLDEVAYVCGQLERIRADLEMHSAQGAAPVERLLAVLRAGEDPTALLDALHEALLAAGDAAGIHGRARGLNPIGADPAVPGKWVLLCPSGQCSRYCWPDGPDAPRCRINDQPLRRERL